MHVLNSIVISTKYHLITCSLLSLHWIKCFSTWNKIKGRRLNVTTCYYFRVQRSIFHPLCLLVSLRKTLDSLMKQYLSEVCMCCERFKHKLFHFLPHKERDDDYSIRYIQLYRKMFSYPPVPVVSSFPNFWTFLQVVGDQVGGLGRVGATPLTLDCFFLTSFLIRPEIFQTLQSGRQTLSDTTICS